MLKFIKLNGGKFMIAGYLVNCNGHPFKRIRGAVCREGDKDNDIEQEKHAWEHGEQGKAENHENGNCKNKTEEYVWPCG